MKRVVSLWFPRLATDRLTRLSPHLPPSHPDARRARDWQAKAAVTLLFAAGGTRIAAANPRAAAAGIRSDMRLADARTLVPDLLTAHADPPADRRLLETLAGITGVATRGRRKDDGVGARKRATSRAGSRSAKRRLHVLVAEDNAVNRTLVTTLLIPLENCRIPEIAPYQVLARPAA